jgi:homoserine O-acetyltransferase/O-succinyltransferase
MRVLAFVLFSTSLVAADQQFYELKALKLVSGKTVSSCRVGYRTFGTLNEAKSNAVVFPTWFSGKSAELEQFFGAGKLVDTRSYFGVAIDALGNGVSCSPSNVSGGLPQIAIADMVQAEYRVLTEGLGLKVVHAVVGISMGGMQTFEWIARYPDFMKKAVPIIGSPKLTTADLLLWQAELSAIEAAEACHGDRRNAMFAVQAMHRFALRTPEYWASSPADADWIKVKADLRSEAANTIDPADWAAQLRAMMAQDVAANAGGSMQRAAASVRARTLVVIATQDHMVNPTPGLLFAEGAKAEVLKLTGNCGHMATSCESAKMTAAVRAFLAQ